MTHDPDHPPGEAPSEIALRVKAIESLLVDKGLVDPEALDAIIDHYERRVGPRNGARLIARAWKDAAFYDRMMEDAGAVAAEYGFVGVQGEHLVAVENAATVHNLVVCTLCSCYPWPVLGLPPPWYKSPAYRSRAVIDPRGVLLEFGVTLAASVEVRVWDSTAEIRYLVVPERPADADQASEDDLAARITRNGMIGAARL